MKSFYRDSVNSNAAGADGNKTIDGAEESSFTRATGAEDGHLLPAVQGERDAVQDRRRVLGANPDQVVDCQYRHRMFSQPPRVSDRHFKTFSALLQFFSATHTCHHWRGQNSCHAGSPGSDRPSLP